MYLTNLPLYESEMVFISKKKRMRVFFLLGRKIRIDFHLISKILLNGKRDHVELFAYIKQTPSIFLGLLFAVLYLENRHQSDKCIPHL